VAYKLFRGFVSYCHYYYRQYTDPAQAGFFISTDPSMKPVVIQTEIKKMLADVYTPVGIYLRLRDRFRDTILLESADHHAAENSYSFICINAIAGIEVKSKDKAALKMPGEPPAEMNITNEKLPDLLWNFMQRFQAKETSGIAGFAQGFYGYFNYSVIPLVESIRFREKEIIPAPLARYRLYQYVIVINHYKDELFLCENKIAGLDSELTQVESLIRSKDVPVFPFQTAEKESAFTSEEAYTSLVKKAIANCHAGDVFQLVLSRRFSRQFSGDEFNVYRALRHINPSPYLFYFDYGDYRLMGSSPEAQLVIEKNKAYSHPIAGTFLRTGDDAEDSKRAEALLNDPKENAEHVMLVDLARNDLNAVCKNVEVTKFRQVQYYSHVIHLVSEVQGDVEPGTNPFKLIFRSFPAGTLSGAPKYRAMELIDEYENHDRGFYGGAIGFAGLNGSLNHAIMIRSIMSYGNQLFYQAGAGIVAASNPASELQEVNNKIAAIRAAITLATEIGNEL
jgi:anthranilate synthase component I